ncbi:GIY-YIG nuclease family protein [Demetria terragena]|uniref:GIY-YIG nuclease family protein n=1 Tax=Demetria terragena TaxID=63959 RepID=UPI00037942B0|nr:GIY-YIG nuclease family protein [Demetria terragena]
MSHSDDMPSVYMLRCGDGTYYVGSTRSLQTRLDQHASGHGAKYTARRLPIELVWSQEYASVAEAYAMEKKIQGWSRAKREALIEGRFGDLPKLARKRSRPR